jgi:hypothetical protein
LSAPTPELLHDICSSIASLAADLDERYAVLHDSGYERSTAVDRSAIRGRSLSGLDGLMASTSRIRNKLDQAGRKSRAAEDALKGALNALDEIVADINEAIARQSPVDPTSDRLFPRTEEKDERRAADNQRRRHQTGWEKGKGRMPWHARTGD